ncbi:MAG: signal peptide peptidase SppA [Desulfovibrio sp.]|jgi:protease-4|nr:signal peptide peptidase SppA [Desulfovibrio sp.]
MSESGETWIRVPLGAEAKKPWRKRHPLLFVFGVLLLLSAVFGAGKMVGEGTAFKANIAVVNIEGLIMDSGKIVAFIDEIIVDSNVKGAVVRIVSPGGGVGASQEIFAAVKRLSLVKPTAASMGAVAASGGYYAALGTQRIFAGPSTVTGSIGVKMQVPNLEGLLRTIGVAEKTLTTGGLKDAGNISRPMSPEEEAYLRSLLADMYEEFIKTVANERELEMDKVLKAADGRALTGRQALALGLVDELGDFHVALRYIQSQCGLAGDEYKLLPGPKKKDSLFADLMDSLLNIALEKNRGLTDIRFMYE